MAVYAIMIATSLRFRGYGCFKSRFVGFDPMRPINVVIGRNNSGKSHLLDIVHLLCGGSPYANGLEGQCEGILEELELRKYFAENYQDGQLPGNHWREHGRQLIGARVAWTFDSNSKVCSANVLDATGNPDGLRNSVARGKRICELVQNATHVLSNSMFRRIQADRDIRPELPDNNLALAWNGMGATNIIRRLINSTSEKVPLNIIDGLLVALNEVFGKDGCFTQIDVKEHDEPVPGYDKGTWELHLREEGKGLIPLSRSGSGLKTVILVLLNLIVVPVLDRQPKEKYVFAFEELENNLHPALLRRLFRYLEDFSKKERARIFLTTHSSVALDVFGTSENAQIILVSHDGKSANTRTVSAHFEHLGAISEIGAKPSDLLQANGIIWVEGPSDRIYINRWIELFGDGKWREGRHYQCAFYGGALLARVEFVPPEDELKEFVNLVHFNPNVVVICDSDCTAEGAQLKDRVVKIQKQISAIPNGLAWVTKAKEIENYLPGDVLAKTFEKSNLRNPGQFEEFFPTGALGQDETSYIESQLGKKSVDKVNLALKATVAMTKENLSDRFDLVEQISVILAKIENWNA